MTVEFFKYIEKIMKNTNQAIMNPESCILNPVLPPEWAPQSGIMLTWPHQHGIWVNLVKQADITFTEIAKQIALRQLLLISYYDVTHKQHIVKLFEQAQVNFANIKLVEAKSNDIWVRDHGPITVIENNQPKVLDFSFNAWGGKYKFEHDDALIKAIAKQGVFGKTPVESINFVLEGGGIEVDGKGTMLTTESVLLTNTRNHTTREEVEKHFKQWFGIERTLWLTRGHLQGDDTDGHIDTLARFVDAETICYVSCSNPDDEHYEPLMAMYEELKSFKNYAGKPYKLIALPLPVAQFSPRGERLPATYANFLMLNKAVLLPIYGDKENDIIAQDVLRACFPNHEIVPINCRTLINFYGSLHCATMQLPVGVLS